MQKEPFEFLRAIEETPSPSGFEQPVQRIIAERRDRIGMSVRYAGDSAGVLALQIGGARRVVLGSRKTRP